MGIIKKCKYCDADIIWMETAFGKMMPCEPQPVDYWVKPKAKGKIVTPMGKVLSCEFEGDPDKVTGRGYIPHFSNCKKSET